MKTSALMRRAYFIDSEQRALVLHLLMCYLMRGETRTWHMLIKGPPRQYRLTLRKFDTITAIKIYSHIERRCSKD